jgi:hypothetical protein
MGISLLQLVSLFSLCFNADDNVTLFVMTDTFRLFPQYLYVNSEIVSRLAHLITILPAMADDYLKYLTIISTLSHDSACSI